MRLIDADALLEDMHSPAAVEELHNQPPFLYADVVDAVIDAAPTVAHGADSLLEFIFDYFNERDPDAVADALAHFDRRQS
jgi:hypothetical protein